MMSARSPGIRSVLMSSCAFMGAAAFLFVSAADAQEAGTEEVPVAGVQTDEVSRLGTIVVTAQKREENLQDVPVAVTAFSSDMIEQLGFEQINQVAWQTPNFTVTGLQGEGGGGSTNAWLSLRGISFVDFSNVNDGPVALYIDEVFQPAQGAALSQLFDVERVEVLKGPQGTLFGRNTTAGLVHFISREPGDELNGYLTAQAGSFDKRVIEGAVGGPVASGLRMRVAARYSENGEMQSNPITGQGGFGESEVLSLRGTLAADLWEGGDVTLRANHTQSRGTSTSPVFFGVLAAGGTSLCGVADVESGSCFTRRGLQVPSQAFEDAYAEFPLPLNYDKSGVSAQVRHDFGWADFTSISSLEQYETVTRYATTPGPYLSTGGSSFLAPFFNAQTEALSQEFRLSGDTEAAKWVLGAYAYKDEREIENFTAFVSSVFPGNELNLGSGQGQVDTSAWAVFAQVDTELTDKLSLIVGGRYTDEERTLERMVTRAGASIAGPEVSSFSDFSGDITLNFKPADSILTYVKLSRGFKSGGFAANATSLAARGPADAERLTAWEAGWKSDLLGNRLRLNGAVFHYDFQGLQANAGTSDQQGNIVVDFLNAGDATVTGAEIELTAVPTDAVYLSMGLGLLDSEIESDLIFDGSNVDGNSLPGAPELNANVLVRYSFPQISLGAFDLQFDARYQSETSLNIDANPYELQEAYGIANLRLLWTSPDGAFNGQVFVENLNDETYYTNKFYAPGLFDVVFAQRNLPRTWGVRLGYEF